MYTELEIYMCRALYSRTSLSRPPEGLSKYGPNHRFISEIGHYLCPMVIHFACQIFFLHDQIKS